MVKMDWDDKFNLQFSCQLQFPVGVECKRELLNAFSELHNKYYPFGVWFDNPDVPNREKDPYSEHSINANNGLNFLYNFFLLCGCTELEIKEYADLPF